MSTLRVNAIQNSAGSAALSIDTSAYITVSNYITSNNPFFIGYFSSYTSNTSNYNPFLNTTYNRGFTITGSTSRIQVPIAGKYVFYAHQLANTTGGVYLFIRRNGVDTFNFGYSDNDSTYDIISSATINLSANDYVDFYYQGTTTYTWAGLGHSIVQAYLVS